ncbi:MAG: zinc metallopeptidase [Christensenellales bacterium]|jgi:Zn-dependent membrane protease YugP
MDTLDILYIAAGILFFPAIIWMIIAGLRVRKVFRKYNQIASRSAISGSQMAKGVLERAGLNEIDVILVNGALNDHFDPRDNTVYLSAETYNSTSVAALGIAAHEVGHAIQHNERYAPLKFRTAIAPVINITSRLAFPLILIGIMLEFFMYLREYANYALIAGIIFYGSYTLFTLITLPVEYNASRRAKSILYESGILTLEETKMASEVLSAAAKTYLAAFVVSLLQFLRLLSLFTGRRR